MSSTCRQSNRPDRREDDARRHVALYSHDTMGLGHLRRNLAIAARLAQDPVPTSVLLISGIDGVDRGSLPPGLDLLTLPGVAKRGRRYAARALRTELEEITALRSAVIASALSAFQPDLLIVDKVARGIQGELDLALEQLTGRGRTRCVLGLRDILDDPGTTVAEWRASRTHEAVEAHYDAVWWYGDPRVFDPVAEYSLRGALRDRSTRTGYLARRAGATPTPPTSDGVEVLCLVGGGQDGGALASAFVRAPLGPDVRKVVVTGPFMAADERRAIERTGDATVLGAVPDCATLIAGATAVVTMGGYNTVCELLAAGTRPLVVPRTYPRVEQLIRATRLAELGAVDMLHPRDLSPGALASWIELMCDGRRPPAPHGVDLDGLERLPVLIDELLRSRVPKTQPSRPRAQEPAHVPA